MTAAVLEAPAVACHTPRKRKYRKLPHAKKAAEFWNAQYPQDLKSVYLCPCGKYNMTTHPQLGASL